MKKYTISRHTLFDSDENLYFVKMGIEGKNMPVHYTVWGKTPDETRERANTLAEILTAHYSPVKINQDVV